MKGSTLFNGAYSEICLVGYFDLSELLYDFIGNLGHLELVLNTIFYKIGKLLDRGD